MFRCFEILGWFLDFFCVLVMDFFLLFLGFNIFYFIFFFFYFLDFFPKLLSLLLNTQNWLKMGKNGRWLTPSIGAKEGARSGPYLLVIFNQVWICLDNSLFSPPGFQLLQLIKHFYNLFPLFLVQANLFCLKSWFREYMKRCKTFQKPYGTHCWHFVTLFCILFLVQLGLCLSWRF